MKDSLMDPRVVRVSVLAAGLRYVRCLGLAVEDLAVSSGALA